MNIIVNQKACIRFKGVDYLPGCVIRDVEEKDAKRLVAKGKATAAESDDDGVIARTPPPEKMTIPELKDLLDKLEVVYPADAKKADLVKLVYENTQEPPTE